MSVFDRKSRYLKYATTAQAVDRRGRVVNWVTPAHIPDQALLGEHRRKQGQRLDRLSAHYCEDPAGFWRIAAINEAPSPDAAAELPLVKIPAKDA